MKNEIQELKIVIDQLLIEASIHRAEFNALLKTFNEISEKLLNEKDAESLELFRFRTLYSQKNELSNHLDENLFDPAKGIHAMFDFESAMKSRLKDFEH